MCTAYSCSCDTLQGLGFLTNPVIGAFGWEWAYDGQIAAAKETASLVGIGRKESGETSGS